MSVNGLTPTSIGPHPPHWTEVRIEEVAVLLTNGYVGPSLPHQKDGPEGAIRYLQGFNVRPNKIDLCRSTWVTREFHTKNQKSCLHEGDLLIVQSGHIGTAAVVPKEAAGANCHALILVRLHVDRVDPYFVAQYINSDIGQARLRGLEVGSSLLHINTSELGKFKIPLPSLAEQMEISTRLSLWDRAIDTSRELAAFQLERYAHECSKAFKTHSRRCCKIVEIAREVSSSNRGNPCDRVLSVTNSRGFVLPEEQFERRVASEDLSNYKRVMRGQFAYNPSRINIGSIARLDDWDQGVLSPMYVVFEVNPKSVDSDYFLHWLRSHEATERIKRAAQGSVRQTVSFTEFAAISFPLPSLDRQREIARYLTSLTEEIALLRRYSDLLRRQKRGLMQKLLTGEWRIQAEEVSA